MKDLLTRIVQPRIREEFDYTEIRKVKFLHFTCLVSILAVISILVFNTLQQNYASALSNLIWAIALLTIMHFNQSKWTATVRYFFLLAWLTYALIGTHFFARESSGEYDLTLTLLISFVLFDSLTLQVGLYVIAFLLFIRPDLVPLSESLSSLLRMSAFFAGVTFFKTVVLDVERSLTKRHREALKDKDLILQQANKIAQNERTKDNFFANVSHELRTPLMLITGRIQSLLNDDTSYYSSKAEKLLQQLKADSDNLLNLSDEIRELISIGSGNLKLTFQKTEAQDFFKAQVELFRSATDLKKVALVFQPAIPQSIHLDKRKMEKVMQNLLSNALKHSVSGGTITVSLQSNADHITIKVADTGLGIKEEDRPFIFDRYYQCNRQEADPSQGLGIGLTITHDLVKLHGGSIAFQPNQPSGAVFNVCLPLNLDKETINQGPLIIHPEPSAIPVGNRTLPEERPTIMLVDDQLEIRQYLAEILSDDYKLLEASNGMDAVSKLKTNPTDLVIADLMMPFMDGFQLVKAMNADPLLKGIPILVISARYEVEDRLELLDHGVSNYLSKPFNHQELKSRIELLLKERKNQPELGMLIRKDVTSLNQWQKNALYKLDSFIIENISNQFTIDQLAEVLSTSRRGLFRMIKTLTGLTPAGYLKKIRFQYAYELLSRQEVRSAREASQMIGFKNSSEFSKQFEKRFGRHPKELLQKQEI